MYPNEFLHKNKLKRYERELDRKVPEIQEVEEEWNGLSEEEREARTRNDSLKLLEEARRIDVGGWCEVIDRYYAPSEQRRPGSERNRSQTSSVVNCKE